MISVGDTFDRLTVVERLPRRYFNCSCSCGMNKKVRGDHLQAGKCRSCGCYRSEATTIAKKTHGLAKTRVYRIWRNMINRCYFERHADWKYYGGRGISVCDEWRYSFEKFFNDMGSPGENLSIDRINVNGNYEKKNCRWATAKEQAKNRRPATRIRGQRVIFEGKEYRVSELVSIVGLSMSAIYRRLDRGLAVNALLPKGPKPCR